MKLRHLLLTTALASPALCAGQALASAPDISPDTILVPATNSTAITAAALAGSAIHVASFGAVGDMTQLGYTSYTIAASSTALSATAGVFNSGMVGKTVVLPGAGASGGALVANISSYTDQGHVTLSTAANTALSGVTETPEIGTDNTQAFNNAIAAAEARNAIQASHEYIAGSVDVDDGTYLVKTINLVGNGNYGLKIFGHGTIWGVNAGNPVVDALGTSWLDWSGVNILGDQYAIPSVGIQIGRIGNQGANSSDNSAFSHFLISGWFSEASLLNEQSETTEFDKVDFYNNYATGIAVAQDGYDHFAATTTVNPAVTDGESHDVAESFDENVFLNCIFGAYTPLWIGNTNRMTVLGGYATAYGPYGVRLFSEPNSGTTTQYGNNIQLDLDLHIEGSAMTDAFFITGMNSSPSLEGFRWREHGTVATNSAFKVDSTNGVSTVNMTNAYVDVQAFINGNAKLFDNPAVWGTVTGQVSVPNASFMNLPSFQGLLSASSTPGSVTDTSVLPSASVLSALSPEGVNINTSVGSVSITTPGIYYEGASSYTPTVTFSPAPTGGTTATGHVSGLILNGEGNLGASGSGYSVANNVPVKDQNGNTLFTVNITSVSGNGAIAQTGGLTFNATATPLIVGAVPASPLAIAQPGGSGGTVTGTNFAVTSVVVDNKGSGYAALPSVTFSGLNAAPLAAGQANSVLTTISSPLSVGGSIAATGPVSVPAGTKVNLDMSGNGWVEEDAGGLLVFGSGNTRAMSLNPTSGALILKGALTQNSTP